MEVSKSERGTRAVPEKKMVVTGPSSPNVMPYPLPGGDLGASGRAKLDLLLDAMNQTTESAALLRASRDFSAILPKIEILTSLQAKARPSILVVEDDALSYNLIEDTFEGEYDVLWASDGRTALETAAAKSPDLILLDVMMPTMDGYEVCVRLKVNDKTRAIPVIFITGLGDEKAETRGLELGAVDYVTKPINPTALRARVSNHVKLKWALERLTQVAAFERSLREEALEELEINTRNYPIH